MTDEHLHDGGSRDRKIVAMLKGAGAKSGFGGHSGPPKHPGKLPPELLRP